MRGGKPVISDAHERLRIFAVKGTVSVTPYPVRLGTTYLDAAPVEKPGSVTEFDRPRHITFHHTVLIQRGPLRAEVDARVRYTFLGNQRGTLVRRELELTMDSRGLVRLVYPSFFGVLSG
jgi:hypothetical protein